MRVLVAEDDPVISQALLDAFQLEHFETVTIADGAEALHAIFSRSFDLILLDMMLPEQNGDQVLKHVRDANIQTPVIILSALDDIYTKVLAFDIGADDYMVKPFEFQELLARMKALLRKRKVETSTKLTYQDLLLDLPKHEVSRSGATLGLREKEMKILEYLMMHPEQVLTREMIMNYVWGHGVERATNVVDVHIHYLREKIDKPYRTQLVKTVNSVGYKLSK